MKTIIAAIKKSKPVILFAVAMILTATVTNAQPYNQNPTQSVCTGIQPYYIDPVAGASYYWSISGGGAIVSGNTTNSITVDWTTPGGPYTLSVYTSANGCDGPVQSVLVTVTLSPTATISYGSGFICTSASPVSVTQTGTTGGTYTATPAGLTINATTGQINPATSTPGTYTVYYTIAGTAYCAQYVAPTTVTIASAPSATIAYAGSPYCTTASPVSVTLTGTTGGTYSATPTGLTINPSTGVITPATSLPGNYTVQYTIAASGGCAAATTTYPVVINQAPTTSPIWHN